MCQFDNDDVSTVWADTERTARKPHRCSSCGITIAPGWRYHRIASLFDGSWSTARQCMLCNAISARFLEEHSGGPFPTELREALRSCVEDSFPSSWVEPGPRIGDYRERARAEGREWRTYMGWMKWLSRRDVRARRKERAA